ncbi:MAG: putative membrane protein [Chloroflexota bacterium]|nr:MAG: putative membrane protein [Chloroflexota bacterium]
MFKLLGRWATRYRYPIIIGWIVLAAVLTATAPSLEEVATTDDRDFLPREAEFFKAEDLYKELYPDTFTPSSGMILVDASGVGGVHAPEAWAYLEQVTAWLMSEDAPDNIGNVTSPTLAPEMEAATVSPDGQVGFVAFGLTTGNNDPRTDSTVEKVDDWVGDHRVSGLKIYHTGDGAINYQTEKSAFETIDRTLYITIVLVIVFLLLIYRSPVSPFIPLFAVTMALMVTTGLLGFLGDAGILTILTEGNALLIVVMYGAGTDYCLFLISRFREEMAADDNIERATRDTVHLVGETITSSASTIFVGFMAMAFAEMGFFKNSGPMLALAIVVGLLAGLTLTPALLSVLGQKAFWPGKAKHRGGGRWYEFTSRQASSRPLLTIAAIVVLMLPFSIYGLTRDVTYEFMEDYPDDIEAIQGYHVLEENFGKGLLYPLTVVVADRPAETVEADMMALTETISNLGGIEVVQPLGSAVSEEDGGYFRLNVLLSNEVGTDGSVQSVEDIEDALKPYQDAGRAGVTGNAVVITEMKEVMDRDLLRAFGFVLVGIFVVLLLMLRSAIAPIYLICTVLLSYTFTLGITNIVFDVFFDTPRLLFMVEFFMFVFLVALGIDYSIFLFGRIKEEVSHSGLEEGVHVAVSSTGAIITSAGLILAGTFAGLMAGELAFLGQIGFAVAFGVLVDTFVVRTILDPALARLFGKWTWWPGGIPRPVREKPVGNNKPSAEVSAAD